MPKERGDPLRSRILVVGHDIALRGRLARLLNGGGYRAELAESALHARRIGLKDIALAIVVQEAPGPAAGRLLEELEPATGKVLVVAAHSSSDPGSDVLDAADEAGLLARVSEALRPAPEPDEVASTLLQFAEYSLDLAGHSLVDPAGNEVPLTRGEFRLLQAFVQRPGRVLSRDHLLQALAGRDAEAFDRSIDMLVVRLRRKIEPDPKRPRLIVTIPGSGYKFTAKVQQADAGGALVPKVTAAPAESRGKPEDAPAPAERRQVTALSAELIAAEGGSLPADPEELHAIVEAFRRRAAAIIARHGGAVAQCVARTVLAYFGHPAAQEDAAERAIHAGLALIEHPQAGEPESRSGVAVRAGIATGLVIADPVGEIVGEAPSEAASLQAVAEPGQVVTGPTTRRLTGQLFAYQAVALPTLKGGASPAQAWRVLAENRALGRFEALRSSATPLVGRAEEQELLLRRWGQSKSDSGRVVLISGEPGVGKSRLAEAVAERIADEPHLRLRYFCSPHHQDSALHPVIVHMERAAGFAREDAPLARLAKLQALLAATGPPIEVVALIADLLSLPTADLAALPDASPHRKKEKTFEALLRQVELLAQELPVLMVYEDIHWIDPSSRELLERTMQRIANWPVLLVATFRPEFLPPWTGQPGVTMLALSRLDRPDTAAMVANIAGDHALPDEIVREIAERTDGVPLFVEELTKAVLESGEQAAAALSAVPHPALSVPATLHASLMARLDRQGPAAKDMAQRAAAIGREFGYELLASIADLPEQQLCEVLHRLTEAGLVFARGTPPQSSYIFKHALVQDAAYSMLLRGRRQQLHARIAAALEDRFPEIVQAQPGLLAQHCAAAGLAKKAVVYWLKAGEEATARSAMTEAVAQLQKGLDVLAGLPEGPSHRRQELDLLIALRAAVAATKGFSAAEVGRILARAHALAEQLDRPEYLVPLSWGQWAFHLVRSEHRLALSFAEQLEKLGGARNDLWAQLQGRRAQGYTRIYLGEFVAARALLERCHTLSDPAHRVGRAGLTEDPYAILLSWLAMTLASLGYIDQARSRLVEALVEARRHGHDHTLAIVLNNALWTDCTTRSADVHRRAEELLAISSEHGFRLLLGYAAVHRARKLIALGQVQEGLAVLTQGDTAVRATGVESGLVRRLVTLAEAYAMLGQPDAGLNCLAEAGQFIEATEERVSEAELHLMRGDLLNATGDRSAAERSYRQAFDVAQRQSAKIFELRAAIRLARLWRDQGRIADVQALIAPVYAWFTEGFDAPDLIEAKALLEELAAR